MLTALLVGLNPASVPVTDKIFLKQQQSFRPYDNRGWVEPGTRRSDDL